MSSDKVTDLIELFKDTLYPFARLPNPDVITVYDGDHYNDWDYEILGPGARKFIRQTLKKAGYKTVGSRYFMDPSSTWRFFIPKPMNTLGGDIVSNLDVQNEAESGTMILNPTEGMLMLLSLQKYQDLHLKAVDLQNFVRTHPVNIQKIIKMKVDTPNFKIFLSARDHIVKAQADGIQARKFSRINMRKF